MNGLPPNRIDECKAIRRCESANRNDAAGSSILRQVQYKKPAGWDLVHQDIVHASDCVRELSGWRESLESYYQNDPRGSLRKPRVKP